MLLSFQIENFKSILDVTIPLLYAEKKAPNGYKEMNNYPFLEEKGYRTVPVLAFYGANASGKSNIIQAFYLLNRIVRLKYSEVYYNPNRLHHRNAPIVFKIEFIKDGNLYLYTLKVNEKEIIYEKLNQGDNCIFSIDQRQLNFEKLATSTYPIKKLENIFNVECLNQDRKFCTTFLKVIGKNYSGLNTYIRNAFIFLSKDLEVYGVNKLPFSYGIDKLAKTNNEEDDLQNAFKQVVSLLRKLDIDITRMELNKNELNENQNLKLRRNHEYIHDLSTNKYTEIEINSYHKDINGKEVQFNFNEESEGTQRVACLLGLVLSVLQKGTVLVIDELGNSLHPYLLVEIVRLFKDKRYNKNNGQLIFTTHNTVIMDDSMIRVSEIGIINKTLKKGTTFKRISDFNGVRNVTSFRKQYLEGKFSGIPYSYI